MAPQTAGLSRTMAHSVYAIHDGLSAFIFKCGGCNTRGLGENCFSDNTLARKAGIFILCWYYSFISKKKTIRQGSTH
jgi:hypothetical protein